MKKIKACFQEIDSKIDKMELKPTIKIVNVIATAKTGFQIDILKLYNNNQLEVMDSQERYLKLYKLKGCIRVFYNGNLITASHSIKEAKENLHTAITFLKKYRLSEPKPKLPHSSNSNAMVSKGDDQ